MSEIPKAYEPQSVEDKWYDAWLKQGCFTAARERVSEQRPAGNHLHSLAFGQPWAMKLLQLSLRNTARLTATAIIALGLVTSCGPRDTTTAPAVDDKHVLTFTKDNFQTEVLASTQPVLVDFWAAWCGPCKMVAPVVAELATEFEGKARVGKVDVDAETDLAARYNISAIPSLLIFKDGKVVDQIVGVRPKAELKAKLQKFVGDAAPTPAPTKP